MPKVTSREIEFCYDLGLAYHKRQILFNDAVETAVTALHMNKASASDYIRNVDLIIKGKTYKRTINPEAISYYLTRIATDFGLAALMTALKSVESHIEYYEGLRNTTRHTARQAVSDIRARFVEPDADEGQNAQFQRLVVQSLGDNEPERLARLSKLSGVPVRKTVEVTVFQRNPDVVAQALVNAKGVCQRCCQPAPFTRKDGAPYLEVHHIIPLAIGGLDTLGNVAAICPNCHREAHFGSEPITFLSTAASAR